MRRHMACGSPASRTVPERPRWFLGRRSPSTSRGFQEMIATTSTVKPRKSALAAEGLHPATGDAVFIFDAEAGAFRLLDAAAHDRLPSGGYEL